MVEQMKDLLDVLYREYPDAAILTHPQTAHMVVDGQSLLSKQSVPGVNIEVHESEQAVSIELTVARGIRVENPIHTCIGMTRSHGSQRIRFARQ